MTDRTALDLAAAAEVRDLASRGLARAPMGVEGIDVVSNDYLGLRRDPRVREAAHAALDRAGLGAGAARLLGGDDAEHRALEREAAAWLGEEAGVLFPTGTAANVGLLGGLLGPEDLVVSEAGNHGSLVDGIRLSRARTSIVPRGAPEAVERALRDGPAAGRRYVVLESLHGMDGDAAELRDLADVARRRGALLLVDEAHAVGVLGPAGAGLVAEAGVGDVVAARTVPCGKALAGAGGLVLTSRPVADLLVHRSRAYAYTTALPPAVAAGVREALRIARRERDRAGRALAAARHVEARLRDLGEAVRPSQGAFVPWVLGTCDRALAAAAALRAEGFAARAVRPPTVPEGTARVRISCHADLPEEALARLLAALGRVREHLP